MSKYNKKTARQEQEKVLIVSYPDDFLELFGPKHITAKIVRCPAAFNSEMQRQAEGFLELSLPPAWRPLFYPGYCRASASLRPLLPTTIQDAKVVSKILRTLSKIEESAA
jgi:hypothetical protein